MADEKTESRTYIHADTNTDGNLSISGYGSGADILNLWLNTLAGLLDRMDGRLPYKAGRQMTKAIKAIVSKYTAPKEETAND